LRLHFYENAHASLRLHFYENAHALPEEWRPIRLGIKIGRASLTHYGGVGGGARG
jgi:hypothetical protein